MSYSWHCASTHSGWSLEAPPPYFAFLQLVVQIIICSDVFECLNLEFNLLGSFPSFFFPFSNSVNDGYLISRKSVRIPMRAHNI